MYVTPPDTDIYAIPRILAPMPQKVFPFVSCDDSRLRLIIKISVDVIVIDIPTSACTLCLLLGSYIFFY